MNRKECEKTDSKYIKCETIEEIEYRERRGDRKDERERERERERETERDRENVIRPSNLPGLKG